MSRKLLYMVIAIALLIGMVPGVVMAQSTRELPAAPGFVTDWNVLGTVQKWTIPYPAASDWAFTPKDGLNGYSLISGGKAGDMSAEVKAESMGALSVQVTDTEGTTYQGEKKWGKIWETQISKPGATKMTWSEYWKKWSGSGQASDLVIGAFVVQQGVQPVVITNPADGAIVHWYLFNSRLDIAAHNLNRLDDGAVLKAQLDFLLSFYGAEHVWFTSGNVGANDRYTQTISGDSGDIGRTNVSFAADAEEAVRIIALVDYAFPQGVQALVRPEFTSWNFWTQEMEKVPQVRWAGEKIVLEKYWGIEFVEPGNGTYVVHYALEGGSPGTLESLHGLLFNQTNSAYSVWAPIDPDGVSRCILTSEKPGEADVTASLYWYPTDPEGIPIGPGVLLNQHGFVVFFLKFESITLTKVPGERSGHNTGDWIPGNPCIDDPTPAGQLAADLLAKEANVSADDLLRVRVRGWFMGDDQSIRQKEYCDVNGNGILDMYDYVLPEGRWVLPDDWQYLAGPQWQQFRSNYDIMNTPSIPSATSYYTPLGPYYTAAGEVGNFPVIGPYSSLDGNMAVGLPYTSLPGRQFGARDTTVPDGILNWYDCPMPPAKVTFEILSGPGYFRAADKADIYYMWDYGWRYWTNPYYAIEIPAGQEIPPFCNNGGYDWDSWGWSKEPGYGPYWFWRIINRLPFGTPLGATMPDDPAHPTKVQVYTDNHGEAMVYINGDWNLNLPV
ncbi:MAG: hypothetical protein FJ012_05855, partial [Chloroflexi bacterium]|nr:hypothetical protein [Chloroflexota bacterium]